MKMNRKTAPFSVKEASASSGFLIWQVTMLWQRRIAAALRPLKLTQVQFALLASLLWLSRSESSVTQAMVARHAKLDMMMTSQVLRALEAQGLLKRSSHPTDTRAKVLTLTKRGRTLACSAVPAVENADRAFFSALGGQLGKFNESLIALINSPALGDSTMWQAHYEAATDVPAEKLFQQIQEAPAQIASFIQYTRAKS